MASIASSATSVLIAHVAAHTSTIRLGAGGIMLPNHAPLTIAEQFGTLGRCTPAGSTSARPRTGQRPEHEYALRRDPASADRFPQDVLELQGYLAGTRGCRAWRGPRQGLDVPLYILGSSLFGASLAAALGLPYAFASHFAPQRSSRRSRPTAASSDRRSSSTEPHLIAGVNVGRRRHRRGRPRAAPGPPVGYGVVGLFGLGGALLRRVRRLRLLAQGACAPRRPDAHAHGLWGTPDEVREFLDGFAKLADADELIVAHQSPSVEGRLPVGRPDRGGAWSPRPPRGFATREEPGRPRT